VPRHIVEVHTLTHTCPADPEPHVTDTWRALLETIITGPCTQPQTIHNGSIARLVDCGTILPAYRHCDGCRVEVEVKTALTTHLGEEPITTGHGAIGLLRDPCPVCGLAVSAIFSDTGRHVLCGQEGAR
jgi:hypothetical protein